MDLEKIERLLKLIEGKNISSLCIEDGDMKIKIKKPLPNLSNDIQNSERLEAGTGCIGSLGKKDQIIFESANVEDSDKERNDLGDTIPSPMVGTFYSSPRPGDPPYVTVGSKIVKGQVICIIEAMKLFNEIVADVGGVITKVCVDNEGPVEYGMPLFYVKKH